MSPYTMNAILIATYGFVAGSIVTNLIWVVLS